MDYSSLHRPVANQEIDRYRRLLGNTSKLFYYPSRRTLVTVAVIIFICIAFILMTQSHSGWSALFKTTTVILVIGTVLMLLATYVTRQTFKHQLLLSEFCHKNGLLYKSLLKNPAYAGIIFNEGRSRKSKDIIYTEGDHGFEIGNYQYITGYGRNQQIHTWGYVRIQLDRQVPNMVLDATKNNLRAFRLNMTNLPAVFKKDQVLSLEGDFDSHFTLYAPKEYKRDALYIFTPDLMALLIDDISQFDAEIVDNYMYIYSSTQFNFFLETTLRRLFAIIETVGAKAESRTKRYSDARVDNRQSNTVALQGRRLRRGIPWTIIIIVIIVVLIEAIIQVSSMNLQ